MIVIGEAPQLLRDVGIATDVRFGSKATFRSSIGMCSLPNERHSHCASACRLWAKSFAKSLDYLVGAYEERGRHGKADSLSGLEIKDQLKILSTRTNFIRALC